MPAPRATKAVITNAIEAAKACGVEISEVVVDKDGSVRIIAARSATVLPFIGAGKEPRRFGQ